MLFPYKLAFMSKEVETIPQWGKKKRKKRDSSSNIISFKLNSKRYLFFHDFIKSRKNINCHLTPILSRLISLMNHYVVSGLLRLTGDHQWPWLFFHR